MTLEKGFAAFLELLPLETAWFTPKGPVTKVAEISAKHGRTLPIACGWVQAAPAWTMLLLFIIQ